MIPPKKKAVNKSQKPFDKLGQLCWNYPFSPKWFKFIPMNESFTAKQIGDLLNVSDETIRGWGERFAAYLSPGANPGARKSRLYTHSDLEILSLVSELKARRMTYDEIEASLQAGQRGTAPEITPGELSTLQSTEIQRRLTIQIEHLQRQVDILTTENAQIKQHDTELGQENAALKATIEALRGQLADQNKNADEIRRLERLIGRLEYEIETLRKDQ